MFIADMIAPCGLDCRRYEVSSEGGTQKLHFYECENRCH